jgi:hypothetical protein
MVTSGISLQLVVREVVLVVMVDTVWADTRPVRRRIAEVKDFMVTRLIDDCLLVESIVTRFEVSMYCIVLNLEGVTVVRACRRLK